MYKDIADYGLIGNCRSAALVSKFGSIDWACLPDFDSPAYFCRLLDDKNGGYFDIKPIGFYQSSQIYKERTNILKTEFFNHSGRLLLTDFMPLTKEDEETNSVPEHGLKFLRRIKAKQGNHKVRMELKVTPNYGQDKAIIKTNSQGAHFIYEEKKLVLFDFGQALKVKNGVVSCEFEIKEGEEIFISLGFYENLDIEAKFSQELVKTLYFKTRNFWLWWASLCRYRGLFEEEVLRSALTLKLLTFAPTGAVIAAPTTSLPEKLGGNLNWDYRYVWLRDASFTMFALLGLGYLKEAVEFMSWIENVCLSEKDDLQIMYGIRGEKTLKESELKHLEGYKKSSPVRIGNGAFDQKQLDVYGEILTTINLFVNSGGKLSEPMKEFVVTLINLCAKNWKEKDAGIWEPRSEYQHHTYSKVMCWVGIDRGIKLSRRLNLKVNFTELEKIAKEIKTDVLHRGFDRELGAFVSYYGSKIIDGSNFNIPIVGFLSVGDQLVLKSLQTSTQALTKEWLVYRTNNSMDKFKSGEGAFFLATFWVIDTLSILGQTKQAKIWLENLTQVATPLGLYAEEYDPKTKIHLGNFPQAFTHLGLINSVLNLKQAIEYGPERKATTPSERLRKVARIFNTTFENGFELIIPSVLRRSLYSKERRRTQKHSFVGQVYRRVFRKDS